eukprot:4066552-Pyramimonas_sp.AAC.4
MAWHARAWTSPPRVNVLTLSYCLMSYSFITPSSVDTANTSPCWSYAAAGCSAHWTCSSPCVERAQCVAPC